MYQLIPSPCVLKVDVYELNDIICYLSGDSAHALAEHTMKPYPDNKKTLKELESTTTCTAQPESL